jgi:hypothetical protein
VPSRYDKADRRNGSQKSRYPSLTLTFAPQSKCSVLSCFFKRFSAGMTVLYGDRVIARLLRQLPLWARLSSPSRVGLRGLQVFLIKIKADRRDGRTRPFRQAHKEFRYVLGGDRTHRYRSSSASYFLEPGICLHMALNHSFQSRCSCTF